MKIVLLARSKLNSTESTISKALIDNENDPENFATIIDEEKDYPELKEHIRIMRNKELTK